MGSRQTPVHVSILPGVAATALLAVVPVRADLGEVRNIVYSRGVPANSSDGSGFYSRRASTPAWRAE